MAQRLATLAGHMCPAPAASAASAPAASAASAAAAEPNPRLLAGVRVLELATVVAAPSACAILADLGADVLKIENAAAPDYVRAFSKRDDPAHGVRACRAADDDHGRLV